MAGDGHGGDLDAWIAIQREPESYLLASNVMYLRIISELVKITPSLSRRSVRWGSMSLSVP